MSVSTRPEVPLRVITPDDVKASVRRALRGLERAAEEIVWQIELEAWRTLGYSSWGAMREAEYGGAAVMLPTGSRPQVAERLKAIEVGKTSRGTPKHLTDQELADTLGVSRRQVQDDLRGSNKVRSSAQTEPDDVVDAEVVEDDESAHTDYETGEVVDTPKATDPAPAESVVTVACPTCHGTGKVTR